MKLALTAKGNVEETILKYLEDNASEELAKKISESKKTLSGCINFIKGEARKQASGGCAMLTDQEVFGLAIHYFEEESISENKVATVPATVKHTEPEKPKQEIKKAVTTTQLEGQMSMFEMLGVQA